MDVTLTTWFDRTVGGLFGVIKGAFFVSLLFVFIGSFLSGSNNYLKNFKREIENAELDCIAKKIPFSLNLLQQKNTKLIVL